MLCFCKTTTTTTTTKNATQYKAMSNVRNRQTETGKWQTLHKIGHYTLKYNIKGKEEKDTKKGKTEVKGILLLQLRNQLTA